MYTISKSFQFSAAHHLVGLAEDHPCSRVHGHNYTVIVELTDNKTNETGFVKDYRKLSKVKEYIDEVLDHRDLNLVFNGTEIREDSSRYFNPTAENMAKYFFIVFSAWYPQLSAVSVKETDKTIARYTPEFDEQ